MVIYTYTHTYVRTCVQATFMHKAYKQYEHDAWSSKAMLKTIRSKISKGEVILHVCMYVCMCTYIHTKRTKRNRRVCMYGHRKPCVKPLDPRSRRARWDCTYACMYVCVCVCMYGHRKPCVKPLDPRSRRARWDCMHVCMYVCMYVWSLKAMCKTTTSIDTHTHTQTYIHRCSGATSMQSPPQKTPTETVQKAWL